MPIRLTVAGVGLTLDLLLWRAYGRPGNTSDMLRRAHLANPGLARLGPVLPLRTRVVLPDLPPAGAQPRRATVDLFGGR